MAVTTRIASGFVMSAGTLTSLRPTLGADTYSPVGKVRNLPTGFDFNLQDATVQGSRPGPESPATMGRSDFERGLIEFSYSPMIHFDQADATAATHTYDEMYEDCRIGQPREYVIDWPPATSGSTRWKFTAIIGKISNPMQLGSIIVATIEFKNYQNTGTDGAGTGAYQGVSRTTVP